MARHTLFHIRQTFAEGFDPDRVAREFSRVLRQRQRQRDGSVAPEEKLRLKRTLGWEIVGGGPLNPICGPRTEIPDDVVFTARAEGETTIGGVRCIDFKDARGRRWAQEKSVVLRPDSMWSYVLRRKWTTRALPLAIGLILVAVGFLVRMASCR